MARILEMLSRREGDVRDTTLNGGVGAAGLGEQIAKEFTGGRNVSSVGSPRQLLDRDA